MNLVGCFLLHSTKFQYFCGFKSQLSNSYDNWYVQKYLKGIFHKGMLLIWKEYFTCAILSFSSPRCAIIARLNMIYTKFRRAMTAQLSKIWRVWACVRAIARHSRSGQIIRPCFQGDTSVWILRTVFYWPAYIHSGPNQTSEMKLFPRIVNVFKLTLLTRLLKGPEYTSDLF